MKWIALVVVLAACQHGDGSPPPPVTKQAAVTARAPVTDDYRADIEALCDCVHQSGADQASPGERMQLTALWLQSHIATEDAHRFLAAIQPLVGEPKARALETEARRVGIARCPLADDWRAAH